MCERIADNDLPSHATISTPFKTAFMVMAMQHSSIATMLLARGSQVIAASMDRNLNTEDGCCVGKKWATAGCLNAKHHSRKHEHKQQKDCLQTGLYIGPNETEVENKLSLTHEVNLRIAEIISLADIPRVENDKFGEVVVLNLLLCTKIIKSAPGSAILKMAPTMQLFPSISL
ncbi:hypothetical protein CERZMDRAFT_88085 [Cercospora zeae-maydis SCOH1-5]|uniref:Uncharacterized protein n=1 Tax=Cercospora zeae-maydis SCOH1-5 TaxID=717836 RepID=A0A6A6F4C4_9PEZI|nr:hypothetical protein CERZMDRAFT_88085 [Cercospora zeae-maydis SCOH1-5]